MKKIFLVLIIISSVHFYAQTANDINKEKVIRIISENDFWLLNDRTDRFYTQGLKIEYLQILDENENYLNWWPFILKFSDQNIWGLSVGQNLYTSSDITVPNIILDDRPYSAWLYLSNSTISNNSNSYERLTSEFYLGVIGPIALGEEVQSKWHEIIESPDPKGWSNQIKNDVGINLSLKYEKGLARYRSDNLAFDFVPSMEVQVGSVFNIVSLGSTIRFSLFNPTSYFENIWSQGSIPKNIKTMELKPNFFKSFKYSNLSIFSTNTANGVLYNSMLQGGVFSQDSPYLINASDVNRIYANLEYGMSFSSPYFNITYSQSLRTREFKTQANNHQWGKVQLIIKI